MFFQQQKLFGNLSRYPRNMKVFISLFILFMGAGFHSIAQEVSPLSFTELNAMLQEKSGKTRMVNLWATWCKPCVEELPLFMKAKDEMKQDSIDFIFVSVDFQSQKQAVSDKVKQLNLSGTLIHLNEKGNDWIDQLDPNWSGAIPFTIMILPDGRRIYHYDAFENYEDIKNFLGKNLPN